MSRTLPLIVALLLLSASNARADDGRAALKVRGEQAMIEGRYAEALSAYQALYEQSPSPSLLYNLGRAHEGLGQFPQALLHLQRFRREAPADLLARVPALDELIEAIRRKVSTLTVTANVEGAQVLVLGRPVGRTPLPAPIELNAGPSTLSVEKEGYWPFRRDVLLPGGGAAVVEVQLSPRDTTGVLVIRSSVERASVSVDGRALGFAPSEAQVPAGEHRVRVQSEGHEDAEVQVIVAAGERREIDLAPAQKKRIVGTWWFWAGVGVVVASGVLTAALLTERKASEGTFSPGQVAAPLVRF